MVKLNKLFAMSIMFLGCFASVNGAGMAAAPISTATVTSKTPFSDLKNSLRDYKLGRAVLGKSDAQKAAEKHFELIERKKKLAGYTTVENQELAEALAEHDLALNEGQSELSCIMPDGKIKTLKLTQEGQSIEKYDFMQTEKLLGIQINGRFIWVDLPKLRSIFDLCDYGNTKSIRDKIFGRTKKPLDLIFNYRDDLDRKNAPVDGLIVTFHLDKDVTCLDIKDNDDTYLKELDKVLESIKAGKPDIGSGWVNIYLNILAEKLDVKMEAREKANPQIQEANRSMAASKLAYTVRHIKDAKKSEDLIPPNLQAAIDVLAEDELAEDEQKPASNTNEVRQGETKHEATKWDVVRKAVRAGLVPDLGKKLDAVERLGTLKDSYQPMQSELRQKIANVFWAYKNYSHTKAKGYLVARSALYFHVMKEFEQDERPYRYNYTNKNIVECGSAAYSRMAALGGAALIVLGATMIIAGIGVAFSGIAGTIALCILLPGLLPLWITLGVFSFPMLALAGGAIAATSEHLFNAGSSLIYDQESIAQYRQDERPDAFKGIGKRP